jgi:hypothetical protein
MHIVVTVEYAVGSLTVNFGFTQGTQMVVQKVMEAVRAALSSDQSGGRWLGSVGKKSLLRYALLH